jgi:hypothetical protein
MRAWTRERMPTRMPVRRGPQNDVTSALGARILLPMFLVSEPAAAAIRTAFEAEGELSAAIEVRRLFPGITDHAEARACARTIAGWVPPTLPLPTKRRARRPRA